MAKKKAQELPQSGIIYARYSSHNQKDTSIEQQIEECTKHAKELGIEISAIYADRAISGKTDRRPEFQRMMQDAKKGKFKYVIAWKSNRMGRHMLQAMLNEAKLNELGIRCIYVEENFDDTAAGRFALRNMMNVNQFYSENMAEDIRRGLYDNAQNCKITNGSLPFGYKKGEDGRFALDVPKDDIVREIFTRVACGESFANIARDLNARDIKTTRGKPWGRTSFDTLITNERYTGVYIYDNIRIEGGVPQIIEKELFLRVQDILKTKKNPRGRHRDSGDYLLTGKLYCGKCKKHMVGISGTSHTGKMHYYYSCNGQRVDKICDKSSVRRDWLEEEVTRGIKNYILQDDVIVWIADSTVEYAKKNLEESQITLLEGRLSENKRAIKNLMTAIEQGIITATTRERLLELEKEQSELVSKLTLEKSVLLDVSKEEVVAWLESFKGGDISDKKYQAKLIDNFVQSVYLFDDHFDIVFSFARDKKRFDIETINKSIDAISQDSNSCKSSSYKVLFERPNFRYTNQKTAIYMIDSMYIFMCPIT